MSPKRRVDFSFKERDQERLYQERIFAERPEGREQATQQMKRP